MNTYEIITQKIVTAIEAGAGDWRRPWHTVSGNALSPRNTASKKAYRGINTLLLWNAAQENRYSAGEWGTYQQWQDRNCQVRKGEKSTTVVFWKFDNGTKETDDADTPSRRPPMVRMYNVFAAEQCDGFVAPPVKNWNEQERIAHAEEYFRAIGGDVRTGYNRAYFSPSGDYIAMPSFEQFDRADAYYGTLAHEYTHWTGPRVEREMGKRFGDNAYAVEELVAEIGAAFVCARIGIAPEPRADHAAYLAGWLRVLKSDSRAIFTAASKAQQACDYLCERAEIREVAA